MKKTRDRTTQYAKDVLAEQNLESIFYVPIPLWNIGMNILFQKFKEVFWIVLFCNWQPLD